MVIDVHPGDGISDTFRKLESIDDGTTEGPSPPTPSPIQLLPSELLSRIFDYASGEDRVHLFPDRAYIQPASHRIIHVSRHWRSVALDSSEIWDHEIIIDRPLGLLLSTPPTAVALALSTERLEGILKLYGRNFSRARLDYDDALDPLIDIVLQRQDQLVSLSLTSRRIYDKIQHFRMPRLETLLLCRRTVNNARRVLDFDAPKLRKVFICAQAWVPAPVTYPNLPWAQLTHLSFGVPYSWKTTPHGVYATLAPHFWQLLAVVPNLNHLHFTDFKPIADQQDAQFLAELSQPAPVLATLPHLKTLEIHDKDLRSLTRKPSIPKSSVLRFISAPTLETFDLVFSTHLSQENLRDLLQPFLQRTPLLRRMRLVLCSSETFLGCCRPTSLRPITLKFVGAASFFASLVNQVASEGESDGGFVQHGRRIVAPSKDALEEDIWLDGLIDRYFSEEEQDARRFRQIHNAGVVQSGLDERRLIKTLTMDVQNALNISRSNGLLGSQERAHFEQLAEAYEAELLELRQQIEETKTRKRLSLLESRVEETERNLSVSKILSKPSPIRRLPPELLSLVFILACAGEKLDVRLFKESTPPTLLSLLRICKHWRGLAFTTKGVWGTLVFIEEDLDIWRKSNDESDANKAIRVMEGVVNLYGKNLSRLSLDWNFVEGVNRRLFDLVFQNQCQFVSLVLYGGNHIYEYCSTFEMPVLEELLLRCVHHRGKQLSAQFDAPKLRKVFLSPPGEGGDITPDNPLLPWNQITHLSFGMPGVERGSCHIPARYFFDLLPQLSCLTYLHITGVSLPKRRRDHLNPELALPHLKALEVFDHYLSFLLNSPFLTSVSAPSLETLDIFFSVSTFARNGLHKALVPFLQQTPSLRQVRFVAYSEKETLWGRFCQDQLFLQLTGDGPFFAHLSHVTGEGDKNLAQFAQTRSIPKKEWLDGELWTDRLIDRYINRFPVIYLPVAEAGLGGSRCGPEGGEGTTVRDDADGSQSEGEDEDARDETDDDLAINLESGVITEEAKRKVVEMFFREQDRGHRESIRAILFPLLGDFRIPAHVERHVYVFLDHLQ